MTRALSICAVTLAVMIGLAGGSSSARSPEPAASTPKAGDTVDPVEMGKPAFGVFTEKDGLPQNSVFSMAFDQKGYLWVGTQEGAAYYNGRVWTVVDMPNRARSNWVRVVRVASDGSLWFGTYDAGLARLHDGNWTVYDTSSGLPHNRVFSLIETLADDGTTAMWVGTGGGLARFEGGNWTVYDTSSGLPEPTVRSLLETKNADGTRTLWVGTSGGIGRFENGRWTTFDTRSGLPNNRVHSLVETKAEDATPALWAGTSGGLARLEGDRWTVYTTESGLPDNYVSDLLETTADDGTRTLWAGTDGGLARLERGRWTTYSVQSGLLDNQIWDLAETAASNGTRAIWVGTGSGLARFGQSQWKTFDRSLGLPVTWVTSLVETESDGGALWIGTDGGGLARLAGGRWTVYDSASGLPGDSVLSVAETGAPGGGKTLWVGTNGRGLARFEGGGWTTFDSRNSQLPNDVIWDLVPVPAAGGGEALLVCTAGGLARLERGVWSVLDTRSGLPNDQVICALETAAGDGTRTLWVGTNGGGLARFEGGRWTTYDTASALPNDRVLSLFEEVRADGARALWVGTHGGAARLPLAPEGAWKTYSDTSAPALPNNTIHSIGQDRLGRVYLCTVKGIARLAPRAPTPDDPAEFAVTTFTIDDGLPSNETTTGSFMLDRRGRVWVGTRGGATVFDPSTEIADRVSKPLRIERAVLTASNRAIEDGMSLRYDENDLTFEYALLSYFHGGDTRYRVHLVGNDDAPSDWTTDSKKDYTNLSAGNYAFNVWGRDYAGNVTGPVSIAFLVRPAPWRTWWAYLGYGVAGAASMVLLVRLQVRKARRREQEKALIQEAEYRAATAELHAKAAEAQAQALDAEHRRKTKELEEARTLQLSMLPDRLPDLPHLDIAAYMRTATEVGGDYYDFHTSADGVLTVAIGDATGHGLKAGTVVTATKGLFYMLAENPDIRATMGEITRTLKRMKLGRLYMALTLAKVKGNTITLSAAGMPAALVYRASTREVEAIALKGMPLGAFMDFRYEEREITLAPGDTLALMSDGFPEMFNEKKELLGDERAIEIFREAADRSAQEVIEHLRESGEQWAGTRPPDDDVTFVVLKMRAA